MEGPLQLLDSGKAVEMFVILFDDMLLITRRKKALSKKVIRQWIIQFLSEVENMKYKTFSFLVGQKPWIISGKK